MKDQTIEREKQQHRINPNKIKEIRKSNGEVTLQTSKIYSPTLDTTITTVTIAWNL